MKKTIFAAVMALCLTAGTSVWAQQNKPAAAKERPTAEQLAQKLTERMTEHLKLTEAQAKQVYDINLQQIRKMQAMREQMRAARQAEAEQMKSVLTTEQFVQWSQMQGPKPGQHGRAPQMHKEGCKGGDCKAKGDNGCPKKACCKNRK